MNGAMGHRRDGFDDRSDTLLLEYACGALDEATTLLIAAWLTLSPQARARVRHYESFGGALMCNSCSPERMAEDSLRRVLEQLNNPEATGREWPTPAEPASGYAYSHIPTPLHDYIRHGQWTSLCSGVRMLKMAMPAACSDRYAVLMQAKPGAALRRPACRSAEMTLVLNGTIHVGGLVLRPGGLMILEPGQPGDFTADIREGSLCFTVSEGEIGRPKGGLMSFVKSLFGR